MASCPPSFPVQCSGRVVHSPTSLSSLTLSPLQCDCHRCQARSPCRSIQFVLFQLFSTLTSCHTWQSWISPGQHPPAFAPTSVYSVTVHLCMLSCFSRVRLFVTRFLCSWDSPDKNTGVRLPCPPPGDLPDPEIKPVSLCLLHRRQVLDHRASLVAQLVKNPPAIWETWVQSPGWEDPLEKGKATHSSILAWRTPWTV